MPILQRPHRHRSKDAGRPARRNDGSTYVSTMLALACKGLRIKHLLQLAGRWRYAVCADTVPGADRIGASRRNPQIAQ